MFPYNSKNTLNRLIFDSNRKRREGVENASASPPKSNPTPKRPAASSLLGRQTPLQTREFQSSFCHDADEVQQIREFRSFLIHALLTYIIQSVTSSPMAANGAYMRQNESIVVSPGGKDMLQAGWHAADQLLASPPIEMVRVSLPFVDHVIVFSRFLTTVWSN